MEYHQGWEDENEDDGSGYQLADSDPYVDLSGMTMLFRLFFTLFFLKII